MKPTWFIQQHKVDSALRRIVAVSHPRQIILFGSYVQRRVNRNSDLDIFVVMRPGTRRPQAETVRIRRALRGILMPMDILVIAEDRLSAVSDAPGLIYAEILRHGKVVYESRTRYPGHGGDVSQMDAEKAVQLASRFLVWAEAKASPMARRS
jgi:uncharacterized protein